MEVNGKLCIECGCMCGCMSPHKKEGSGRRFLTKTERKERLKSYAEELKKELTAVQEQIEELGNQ